MTYFEGITTAIAVVALIVSAVAMYRAGVANKIAKEANELARAQDALAQLHLKQEHDRRNKAQLSLELIKVQNKFGPLTDASYKFNLKNESAVPATDCRFEILTPDSPLVAQDYAAKLPSKLAPGQALSVLAAVSFDTPSKLDAIVSWTNPDGSHERQERTVTM